MVRTRFAPSPTGYLHLGNIRTAVFAWAFARHHQGQFILRIEDTDLERSSEEYARGIIEDMAWLGLDYDLGPIYQMQRMPRYREVIAQFLNEGKAYHCYCTPEELEILREQLRARGEKPRYDGRWRDAKQAPPTGIKPVVRFKNPLSGSVTWQDGVKGLIDIANSELDDLVIARPDGTPTYNFCVVVDDYDMQITHVLRGDDHVNNTPRQINIFRALGVEPPTYAHLPTVLGTDGEKLSKRHGAASLAQYREQGYLPEAMLNFLARMGWAHGDDEVFSREQLIAWFNVESISESAARFNPDKLRWLNHEHIKRASKERLASFLAMHLTARSLPIAEGPSVAEVAELLRDRAATLSEMADAAHYFYHYHEPSAELKTQYLNDSSIPAIKELATAFATLVWQRATIATKIKEVAARHQLKMPQIMMPLRILVTGTTTTPAVDAVLEVLGRERTIMRLAHHF